MSSTETRTFEMAKEAILSMRNDGTPTDTMQYYNQWAQNYEQDMELIGFRAPIMAAEHVSAHFTGERQTAVVLDVACGTGWVAKMMKREGFQHFVGVDCSEGMLQRARHTGLYRELKMAVLGEQPLPVPSGEYEIVIIAGALSSSHLPAYVIRELCRAAKQGGLICMTGKCDRENINYRASLESEIKHMEDAGLWRCVNVTYVKEWQLGLTEHERGYIPGCVYLFQKL
ncbi:methyltransferase-like protein 27 [Syngnathoides biaculeatus]|uniref:methyltransferase-like protein 27 n=1 Tax=Syngnathoides biaculeatus TaxID=300417 RepID=UPI002ADD906C|nr:methyltransferase-like protein 27 [Syngnathoides biaculeatus]XP_061689189.1 methyltransferase-like protein 27 [Syngnathoides biaculeatus]XP_061689190.1 methyltransferase-like protein 27 [Syngnathoides biaculeatus]XP_061689191.1 methyltransferase-like protein 27 [Syngnathoides biaculeatus]XP_061689192.1 methyltransferase-like protein 27 [Syngnathoides biaculeatus]XP_061689193.1 methyltransferase-like protein 27 [Syngnathoides biaculeatus]XP_061689194.1 methyltransferase-like protein 27 [Syn